MITTIYLYLNGEMPILDFEQWVYQHADEIEASISASFFLELLEFNYRKGGARWELNDFLKKHIDLLKFERWQITHLLSDLISERRDPIDIIEQCYDFYCREYWFLQHIGMQFVMGIDDLPRLSEKHQWNEAAFNKKRAVLNNYLKIVKPLAQKILNAFETGEIVITGLSEYHINPILEEELK